MTTQQLITREELKGFPKLYESEEVEMYDKVLVAKFFIPTSQWTWYLIESDGSDYCFGLVIGDDKEFGYFSLKELAEITDPFGSSLVERDEYFEPITVKEVLR